MLEQPLSEIFRYLFGMILMCFILSVAIFCYQIQEVNTFRQQVNYRIERRGGLTDEAMAEITEYTNDYYQGRYIVSSPQMGQKVRFGDAVSYEIVGEYPLLFVPMPNVFLTIEGQAISQVR